VNPLNNEEKLDAHYSGKQYRGWKAIREKLAELNEKHPAGAGRRASGEIAPHERERERDSGERGEWGRSRFVPQPAIRALPDLQRASGEPIADRARTPAASGAGTTATGTRAGEGAAKNTAGATTTGGAMAGMAEGMAATSGGMAEGMATRAPRETTPTAATVGTAAATTGAMVGTTGRMARTTGATAGMTGPTVTGAGMTGAERDSMTALLRETT
jgi:hypothetical protein